LVSGAFLMLSQWRDLLSSVLVIFSFSLGIGTPVLLLSYGVWHWQQQRWLLAYYIWWQRLFGVILIIMGLGFLFNADLWLSAWLLQQLPTWWLESIYIA